MNPYRGKSGGGGGNRTPSASNATTYDDGHSPEDCGPRAPEPGQGEELIPYPASGSLPNSGHSEDDVGQRDKTNTRPGSLRDESELVAVLAELVNHWARLSPELREGVIGMLRGVLTTAKGTKDTPRLSDAQQ